MSTPSGVPQAPVSAGGVEGQAAVIGEVQQKEMYSLRFDQSSYLSSSLSGSASNRTKWTVSLWFKKTRLKKNYWDWFFSTPQNSGFVLAYNGSAEPYDLAHYDNGGSQNTGRGTAILRDTTAWYHLMLVWDSENPTTNDRMRMYINGSRDLHNSVNCSQGALSSFNNNVTHYIGCWWSSSAQRFLNGYLAGFYFIDGEALEPSAFGELISDVWRPASYSGDYGVNGFHLDFDPDNMVYDSNGKLTQVKDASGNDNHWTAN